MANKIKYGLKNVYYSVYNGTTYGAPVAIPGAVNANLSPVGEVTSFVADNIEYYTAVGNNGYDGTIEIALLPAAFKTACLGYKIDGDGVLFEDPAATPTQFALLFEFTGDDKAIKHVLYNCKASRGNIDAAATTSKEVKTEMLNLIVRPDANNRVKARTIATSDATVVADWYTTVHTYAS
jgi:phi13 family phage major tail protein